MGRKTERLKIETVLRHFKINEIQKNVCPCFPQVTWDAILDELSRSKEVVSSRNVNVVLLSKIADENFESLCTIHIRLCAVDVCLHSHKKTWQAYEMKEPINRTLRFEKLRDMVKQGCRLNGIECDVECVKREDVIWFTLIERKLQKKRGVVRAKPMFCAFYCGSSYLFFNSVPKMSIMKALLSGLLYKSCKKLALSGHDIQSLHTLLKRNEGMMSTSFVPKYVVDEPKVVFEGIDTTQHDNRRKFSEKCFDVDAKLETFTVIGENVTWQGLSSVPNMTGHQFPCSLRISSPNIFSTLKGLMERNVIDPEHCHTYLKNLSRMRKNTIKLIEEEEEESMDDV